MRRRNLEILLKVILFCGIVYFPIFMHLDHLVIRLWDESRQAINSFEMFNSGNWIVTTYDGMPDLWNSKPPLLIWLQVVSMKFFGPGEMAVRLPSAFAALFTSIAIIIFFSKHFKQYWIGLLAIIVLVTSPGYINYHASRTGDYDALITACLLAYALAFYIFITSEMDNPKYLYITFFFLLTAVFAKGIAGMFFIPALLLFTILQKKLVVLLRNKHFYLGAVSFLAIVISYYIVREHYNPGYWAAVKENEIGGRFLKTIEEHQHEFSYYYNNMLAYQFKEWYLLVIPGLISGLIYSASTRKFTIYISLLAVSYFLIISSSKTKLEWYVVPLFPLLAIICSFTFGGIYKLCTFKIENIQIKKSVSILTIIIILILPYYQYRMIIEKVYKPAENEWEWEFHQMAYYLRDNLEKSTPMKDHIVCYDEYNAHLLFYVKMMNRNNQAVYFKDYKQLVKGEYAIAHKKNIKEYIEKNYQFDITDTFNGVVRVYHIK